VDRPAILAEGLRKSFGTVHALNGVDLAVQPATVVGLLGPNGAGKTTAVRILTTLLEPSGGHAEVLGLDVVRDAARLRSVIGLAGQYAAVDEHLTGRENIELVGRLYHLPAAEVRRRADDLLERFDLVGAANRTAKTYSGGMRRRLDLAASLVGRPQVLFLDEPTTGLDIRSRVGLWEVIEGLVADGTTLLLTTQYLEEADRLAKEIVVVDNGLVIAAGTSDELKSQVGGDVLEVTVADKAMLDKAAQVLGRISGRDPNVDTAAGIVRVSVPDGGAVVTTAVRSLDRAKVTVCDLALHRPTLDDVFLALTGHAAEEEPGADGPAPDGASRRKKRSAA